MTIRTAFAVATIVGLCGSVFADLQNVEVGGNIRIRGNYFNWDSLGRYNFIEQRTRLNVAADFTQEVSAFLEFDSYDIWGEDFRSWYLCGNDFRAASGDDVELYQAYIEAENMWGTPLTARIGRQEIALGNEFLVGTNDASSLFTGLSFDALSLTYYADNVRIQAIAAKLAENYRDFGDGDVDFYVVYGSYEGIENVALDAYWMFVRDDGSKIAELVNADEIDQHTVGVRGAGVIGTLDFDLEAAYQFGDVDGVENPCFNLLDRSADVQIDEFAAKAQAGYTFDMAMQPRAFAEFAYFGGGEPDHSFWNNNRTLPFDRLFSNIQYSEFIDDFTHDNGALSNVFVYRLGVQVQPSEALMLKLMCSYFRADEAAGDASSDSKGIGWELGVYADYQYSADLAFRAGYAHFFGEDGLETPPIRWSGLTSWDANRHDEYDYLFIETQAGF